MIAYIGDWNLFLKIKGIKDFGNVLKYVDREYWNGWLNQLQIV